MSGMSNRLPRAMLMSTPRPDSPPAHSRDDRADHREGGADAHAAEDRRAARPGSRPWSAICQRGRPEAARHLEQAGIDGPDPDHRRDRDREEHDQRRDHELAQRGPCRTTGRCSGARARIGIGLGRDEVGAEQPLREARAGEQRRRRRARAPRRSRSRAGSRPASSSRGGPSCRRSRPARTRWATVHGPGRMNDG